MLAGCTPYPPETAERYRRLGYWTGETFTDLLRRQAAVVGDQVCLVDCPPPSGSAPADHDQRRRRTYAELDDRADRLAAGLASKGIRAGDRVVVQLPNVIEFFELIFALFRIGALPVFALPAHRATEIGSFCRVSRAKAYVIADRVDGFDHRELARGIRSEVPDLEQVIVVGEAEEFVDFEELITVRSTSPGPPYTGPQPGADEVAFLQLSGGSTGVPKLIPRTHDDYLYSVRESARICALGPESVYLCVLPAAHNFPLSSPGTLGTLYAGGTVVLAPSPAPEVCFELIESERVTITGMVPPLALVWLQAVTGTDRDLSSLQVLQVGGAKLAAEVAGRIPAAFDCTLQQVFGMAEGLVCYTRLDDPDEVIINTQGRPISADDEIRIVDDHDQPVPPGAVGRLLTRGPYTIRGYYAVPDINRDAFTTDGFYRTGDLVRQRPDGYLVVEGRDKDQINRGGEKVSAEEIENHLLAHPGVHDAAVVAVADDYLGERVCAFVIPAADWPGSLAMKRFLRTRGVASYKIPDKIILLDSFPATGVGKTSRKDLRRELARTAIHDGPQSHPKAPDPVEAP